MAVAGSGKGLRFLNCRRPERRRLTRVAVCARNSSIGLHQTVPEQTLRNTDHGMRRALGRAVTVLCGRARRRGGPGRGAVRSRCSCGGCAVDSVESPRGPLAVAVRSTVAVLAASTLWRGVATPQSTPGTRINTHNRPAVRPGTNTEEATHMTIRFVTSNAGKVREAREYLTDDVEQINYDYTEIQSDDLADIAVAGAKEAFEETGGDDPVLVDDAGLFVDALGGFPGPYSSYVEDTERVH